MILRITLVYLHKLIHRPRAVQNSEALLSDQNMPGFDKSLGMSQFDEEVVDITEDGRRRVRKVQHNSFSLENLFEAQIQETDMFDFADILIIPIINIDGYISIGNRYGKSDWEKVKFKRKNYNFLESCE
jgi:hypothetical protein